MTSWENYILPILVPIIGGVAVYVSAKMSQRSVSDVVEQDSKTYSLDVLKTSLATLTQEVSRTHDQIKELNTALVKEQGKGQEVRAKVDVLEEARIRAQILLMNRDRHIGELERHIIDGLPPPPPKRPW